MQGSRSEQMMPLPTAHQTQPMMQMKPVNEQTVHNVQSVYNVPTLQSVQQLTTSINPEFMTREMESFNQVRI